MSDDPKIVETERSKELRDKIHRLVRRFSRDLVMLVSEEIGARAVKIKNRPGPPVGHKARRKPCPLCGKNENPWRRFGFICKECRGLKPAIGYRQKVKEIHPEHTRKKPETWVLKADESIPVAIPEHLPLKPKSVEVEDVEPDFLDKLVEIVEVEKPKRVRPKAEPKATSEDDTEEFFS
jgi:hypothetical protein